MQVLVDIRKTRLYRVALVAVNAAVAISAVISQAGDLTSPVAYIVVLIAAFNILIVAVRQLKDPTTPTLPAKTDGS